MTVTERMFDPTNLQRQHSRKGQNDLFGSQLIKIKVQCTPKTKNVRMGRQLGIDVVFLYSDEINI